MNLSKAQIKEIAEELDMGLDCYVHKETKKIISLPNRDEWLDLECWEESFEVVDEHEDDYIIIEKMSSPESFRIMEDFANLASNASVRNILIDALNRRKPFRHFKDEVDQLGDTRQQWFDYKTYRYQEYVKDFFDILPPEESEERESKTTPFISGYFSDDGVQYNPNLHPLPALCLSCKKKDDPNEELLCNLTRMDQKDSSDFICFAYEELNS